jgi:hypothetical protein
LDSRNKVAGTPISSTDDTYYYLTASNFAVNKEMLEDSELFATRTGAGSGQEA